MLNQGPFDLLVRGGTVLTPVRVIPDGAVGVLGSKVAFVGRASDLGPRTADVVVDARGGWITPGLIDTHVHGAGGHDVMADLGAVAEALVSHGVTAFLPTLIPQPRMPEAVARVASQACARRRTAQVLGLHLEGPCLSPRQSGGLDPSHFLLPSDRQVLAILDAGNGAIRRMTLAVELPGAEELIRALTVRGIAPSLGHSSATYQQVVNAVQLGLRQATHVFNAMPQFHHREPGPVGAVLTSSEVVAEVIGDGGHVHAAAVEVLHRAKGTERLMLASDAAPPAGLNRATGQWGGRKLVVSDGICRDENGRLMGSATLLDGAIAFMSNNTTIPIDDLVAMASLTPARELGLEDLKGRLEPGADADIAVFDHQWRCAACLVSGRFAYDRSD